MIAYLLPMMNVSTILISLPTTESGTSPSETASNGTLATSLELDGPQSPDLVILVVMLSCFFILGVVGNALAFYIYYQKRDKTTSTLFILSLAATDFFTCLIAIPYTMAAEMLR